MVIIICHRLLVENSKALFRNRSQKSHSSSLRIKIALSDFFILAFYISVDPTHFQQSYPKLQPLVCGLGSCYWSKGSLLHAIKHSKLKTPPWAGAGITRGLRSPSSLAQITALLPTARPLSLPFLTVAVPLPALHPGVFHLLSQHCCCLGDFVWITHLATYYLGSAHCILEMWFPALSLKPYFILI